MNAESLFPRLAELPLVIEACEYDRLHAVLAQDFERITTHVRLAGAGADGLGEDVSVFREDGTTLHETRPSLPLEGEWTLAGCIAAGVGLGLLNHLATEYWLLRIITSGEEPTRNRLAMSTLVRLLVLSVVAVGIAGQALWIWKLLVYVPPSDYPP